MASGSDNDAIADQRGVVADYLEEGVIADMQSGGKRLGYAGAPFGRTVCGAVLVLFVLGVHPAHAQSADQLAALRLELADLKATQAQTAQRISAVEAAIDNLSVDPPTPATVRSVSRTVTAVSAVSPAGPEQGPARLSLSGDVRLRYEANTGDSDSRDRHRGVLRARLRGSYAVSPSLSVGGQLSTGDPDDPNTADVTLGNFADDLTVSLDQAYMRYSAGPVTLTGGKIPLPFTRTDLVWDGDVSPQGVSAAYRLATRGGSVLKAAALYFLIDEAAGGPDSRMVGGQVGFLSPEGPVQISAAVAYYDYRLAGLAGADAGDFRSNLRASTGGYLSDFNLFDAIASVSYSGLGERWPLGIAGDYVQNSGARTSADTGFNIEGFLGRASESNDWRFGYGYAQAEADAVLAAFSNDNLTIGTNYRLHTLSVDYMPQTHTALNLTWYHYRPLDPTYTAGDLAEDWLERVRLNLLLDF